MHDRDQDLRHVASSRETVQEDTTFLATSQELRRNRIKRLLEGTVFAVASKLVVFLVGALSIPLTIRYLGTESFGIWTTISTILSMLLVMDLGVANALTNYLSEAYALGDQEHASRYSTTALLLMISLASLLGLIAWILWPHLDWPKLFDLSAQSPNRFLISGAVAAAVAVFLVGLPANLAPRILGGYQEVKIASAFQAVGSLGNLISIIVLIRIHAGLISLVTASASMLVGSNLLCLLWIWYFHKPWLRPRQLHLSTHAARSMIRSGSEFFILQLAALIVFNSDNFVVMHYLGPSEVASYSVAWKLVSYAALAQTLIAPALWPAYSEAFARNDIAWIRRIFRKIMWTTLGIAVVCCSIFALFGRAIIQVWASRDAVPSETLVLLMCVWMLISTFMNNTSTILVAKGDTRIQAWCSFAAAILNLALSIYWVKKMGAVGVILGTIVSYVVVLIVPQTYKAWQVLRQTPQLLSNETGR